MVLPTPVVEGRISSFQDIHGSLVNGVILNGPALVGHFISVRLVEVAADNLIGIAHNGEVRIVRHDDHLTPSSCLADTVHKQA